LEGSTWWAADFYGEDGKPDERVLDQLFMRYAKEIPQDQNMLHQSVRDYFAKKRQEKQGKTQ